MTSSAKAPLLAGHKNSGSFERHNDTQERIKKYNSVLDGVESSKLRYTIIFVEKLSKSMYAVYSGICCISVTATVFGVVSFFLPRLLWMVVLCVVTWLGAVLGAYGIYKYGAMDEYLKFETQQGEKSKTETQRLHAQKQRCKTDIRTVDHSLGQLHEDADTMNEHLRQYDEIRAQLATMCEDGGDMEELTAMMDAVNGGVENMQRAVLQNRKAQLLSSYYEVCFRDDINGCSKQEWQRFLAKLTKDQRTQFEKKGTFEQLAGRDNIIDLQEFQGIVDEILAKCDDELMQLMRR
eukprot:CAMPEP_0202688392 /NCGR_PEP_ID=MMETSP1385-20130828/3913_1 /ASSEMBLY_ACC=CAM_ASM_000861 /TAXON_ID=933848 /ORGANISM="Elphidium margaritaceum" /LENGTH=292 /DNA_ID=CAMNT_0049343359 /DNA_START=50 /DNA_END=928 /DNA_ORIENTATION=+